MSWELTRRRRVSLPVPSVAAVLVGCVLLVALGPWAAKFPPARGTLVDEAGKPVEGAEVSVAPTHQLTPSKTGPDGEFDIDYSNSFLVPQAQPTPYVVVRHFERNIAAVATINSSGKPIKVRLTKAVTLVGRVTGPDGKGLTAARLRVYIWRDVTPWDVPEQILTDADGRYKVKTIPDGCWYWIRAFAEGYDNATDPDGVKIQVSNSAGKRLSVRDIRLDLADAWVSGVVIDQNGKPVADAYVEACDSGNGRTRTDKEGKFRIEGLVKGRINLYAVSPDGMARSDTLESSTGKDDITLVVKRRQ